MDLSLQSTHPTGVQALTGDSWPRRNTIRAMKSGVSSNSLSRESRSWDTV